MKNVFKVFLSDAKRLSTNVVAIVIIMGLSIIPALYAWFNIMSNWDPYGEEATSNMHIAVYSEDLGYTYGDFSVNVGETIVDGLRENKTIGWVFTETREEALNGVNNNDYYAAFIIPTGFTEDMLSCVSGDMKNPTIQYYENSKKNAIATKITSKVKTTVQNQVNTSIVSTLTELASKSGEVITGDADGVLEGTMDKLKDMNNSLTTYVSILNTLALLTDSASDIVDSTQSIIPNASSMIDSSQNTVSSLQGTVLAGAQTADTIASMIDISMDSVTTSLDSLERQLTILETVSDYTSMSSTFSSVNELAKSTLDVLKGLDGVAELEVYQKAVSNLETLSNDIDTFTKDEAASEKKISDLKKTVISEIKSCKASIKELKDTFDYEIAPKLNQSVYSVEQALITAQVMLSKIDSDFPSIDRALQSYKDTLNQGTSSITATKEYVSDLQKGLEKIIDGFEVLSGDEQYREILDIFDSDPAAIAEFVASPIAMDTVKIYEIEVYGSAMAPFYTVLGLWVGGLILVALIHVKVEEDEELKDVKHWQKFFGRYIVFFLIAQAQTLITVLGDLFFIQIQCPHPFLFWLGSAVMSFAFSIFMYSLTVAFGNVGQAVAVVVMVVQVAGAGGTFPVEVLPTVYQAVYRFLPFTYGLGALRECVGGLYHLDYLKDLGILGIYIVISILIGIFLKKPFEKLISMMEESKEKSGIML